MAKKEKKEIYIDKETTENLFAMLKEKGVCDDCETCALGSLFAFHRSEGSERVALCRDITAQIVEELESRFNKPQEEKRPQELLNSSYEPTISFMKKHGYEHCYMCGTSLNKEGRND